MQKVVSLGVADVSVLCSDVNNKVLNVDYL